MRFFIGAIVSTLVLSPISVLSMAVGSDANSIAVAQVDSDILQAKNVETGTTPSLSDAASATSSNLEKRFCLINCGKKQKHTSGFQCKKKYFSPEKIAKAKDAACRKIKQNKQKNPFPSVHTAFKYDLPGPYLEWPIKRNGRFWNTLSRSRYRIVLTKNCKVVGAVTREKNSSYSKCQDLSADEYKDEDKVEDEDDD